MTPAELAGYVEPRTFMAAGQLRNADGEWTKGGGGAGGKTIEFGSAGAEKAVAALEGKVSGTAAWTTFRDSYFGKMASFNVNAHLRGNEGRSTNIEEGKRLAPKLLKAADGASIALPTHMTVSRAIRFENGVPAAFKPGATITDKGFTSTTVMQKWVDYHGKNKGTIQLNIKLPKGTKVIPNSREGEMVLKPLSSYRITGRKGNVFEAEYVG